MRTLFFALLFLFPTAVLIAQSGSSLSKKEQRQLLKEERRKAAEEQAAFMSYYVDSLMSDDAFVLEADMLFDRYGQSFQVQSTINFVLIDEQFGVFQIGNPFHLSRNGVGGVTYEGSVNSYKKSKNEKKGTYFISYTLQTTMGSFDISIDILASGKADATVRGNFGGSIRYSGRIVGLRESRVFKGTAL